MAGGGGRGVSKPASMQRRRQQQQPLEHRLLLTATLCLLAGGAVMVYSASSARTLLAGQGSGTAYLVKYLIYGAVGLVVMHVVSRRIRLEWVQRITPPLVGIAFVLLLAVLIPHVGVRINGARRWLGAGPVQFQPSEIMKLALVLHSAAVVAARPTITRDLRRSFGPVILPALGAMALIMVQPDMGSALVIALTLASILLVAGVPVRQMAKFAGLGIGLVAILAILEPYRRARLTSFLNPWADAGGAGFQAVQGQIAIGSGGFLGVGPGQSVQKVFYLPEAHTDFILAVI